MRKIWAGAFFLMALYGCSSITTPEKTSSPSPYPQGVSLVEQVEAQPGKVMIPYSKYRLDNGLTVILSPDHSDPLVHVDVTYHVGSAREEVGKSGFAHFFEHMMFQGSKHVGDQEHFRLITEAGGSLNGATNRDSTDYYDTVPSNQLEKVLWLESDRMGFLLDAVSQRKFEIQRDTVKNERAQNYDNRPYGLMWEKMGEAIYPQGHPYSWQTIGYVEDLDKVDVNDLKAFFLRWYGPNNAVLTIGGDIDTQKTLAWVNKYFGSIPKGPEVKNAPKQPAVLPEDRYVTMTDRIQQPMVLIGWPTSYQGADDQTSLDVLASVLGGGTNSYLYQNLVKTQKAVSAGAFHDCSELACNFYVYAMAPAGNKGQLAPLYHELMKTLDEFKTKGVAPERLDEITGMAEANSVFALQSVAGKVSQLASNETFYGQPDRLQEQLDELHRLSPDSIHSAFEKFIYGKHKVTLSVVPKGKADFAVRKATFVSPARHLPEHKKITEDQLAYRHVNDDFDRSVMPKVAEAVQAHTPKLYDMYFDNGAELLGTRTNETPTVSILFKFPAGERQVERGKEGLANLTAAMLEQGSSLHSVEELQAQLDKLGSTISVNANGYSSSVVVSSLAKNLPATMDVMKEVLFHPGFKQQDFDRIKKQMIQSVVYEHQTPGWLASQATRQVLFGKSIFARSSGGTKESVSNLTLNDVKNFYHQYYTPNGAQIVVVGDISKQQVHSQLEFFSQWKGEAPPLLQPQIVPKMAERKVYLVDKPDAPQSIVRLVRRGLPFDATGELYLTQLANFNLAGNFNSRINQNLREDKGYTYGASSYFTSNREVGAIVFSAQVRADSTVNSIIELQKEMAKFSDKGLTDKEMEFLRLAVGQQDALSYETPGQKAALLSSILTYSLDRDYLQVRNNIVKTVDKATLNNLAAKWFNPDDYQIIVVGDAKTLKPQLEKLTIPVEEVEIIR